jgi:glycerol-3-phosphate dehydrogenase
MRPLRGSHLVLPLARLPLTRAVAFLHPKDGRPVFALPWEGAVIFGTTDVDHKTDLQTDPSISADEFEYLLTALQHVFPRQELAAADVTATFSGLRPVVDTGQADPSKESREHAIWEEHGLLTVSGGKLTTFRIMARDALKAARKQLGNIRFDPNIPVLNPPPATVDILTDETLHSAQRLRLLGRYGSDAQSLLAPETRSELTPVDSTPYLFAELRHAARSEGVVHLDDLLLRRVRLGLLVPQGGADLLDTLRPIVQPELNWDDTRWEREVTAYNRLWNQSYSFKS